MEVCGLASGRPTTLTKNLLRPEPTLEALQPPHAWVSWRARPDLPRTPLPNRFLSLMLAVQYAHVFPAPCKKGSRDLAQIHSRSGRLLRVVAPLGNQSCGFSLLTWS